MKNWISANPVMAGVITALFILLLLMAIAGLGQRATCSWYGYQTERETRYAAFVGSMIQTDKGWAPRAELRTEQ